MAQARLPQAGFSLGALACVGTDYGRAAPGTARFSLLALTFRFALTGAPCSHFERGAFALVVFAWRSACLYCRRKGRTQASACVLLPFCLARRGFIPVVSSACA